MRKKEYRIVLPQIDDLQELNIMLSERLEEWAHAYKAEGMQQGEALALQRLLSRRFGVIPQECLTRIQLASLAQIESWFDHAVDAPNLASVFDDDGSIAH
jgi:hypothetical protein